MALLQQGESCREETQQKMHYAINNKKTAL